VNKLKVGLIGCGHIAQTVHLKILARLPGVELVALAETDPGRREKARLLAPGAIAYADYREVLDMPEVEAVVICLPNALHAEAGVRALERGKHIYLEKPIAINLSEARDVVKAWKRAGVVGMMGFNYRFNALCQAAREHIRSGRLGELVGVRSALSTPVRPLPDWKKARRSGGGG